MTNLVYLACPYTHPDINVCTYRFNAATKAAVHLCRKGHIVYSPITMTHPMDVLMNEVGGTLGSDYWVKFDEAFMQHCSMMYILTINGWWESKGVSRETHFFRSRLRAVEYLSMQEVENEWPKSSS
jgi:hypothetical protein